MLPGTYGATVSQPGGGAGGQWEQRRGTRGPECQQIDNAAAAVGRPTGEQHRVLREESARWFFDTGASSNMVTSPKYLRGRQPVKNRVVVVADGSEVAVKESGRVYLREMGAGDIVREKTLLVPSLQDNLSSVSKLDEAGHKVEIDKGKMVRNFWVTYWCCKRQRHLVHWNK